MINIKKIIIRLIIFIAAFTTALARLKLYEAFQKLGEQVLYCDTDSIIYKYKPNTTDKIINTYDNRLGYFKDELLDKYGPDKYITEFVSGGPKNYAYMLNDGTIEKKIKGCDGSYKSSQKLNFNTIKDFVINAVFHDNKNNYVVYEHMKFKKNSKDKSIKTVMQNKKYNFTYDKREIIINPDNPNIIDTLPFGHIKSD